MFYSRYCEIPKSFRDSSGSMDTNSSSVVLNFKGTVKSADNDNRTATIEVVFDESFRDHLDTFKIPYSESDKTWDIVWDNSALCCQSGETYVFSTLTDHFYKTPLLIDEITDAELWIKLNSNLAQKLGWS